MTNPGAYNSYLEVNMAALRDNVGKVYAHLGGKCRLMPVVKANAYSMGIERVTRLLSREFPVDMVGVAQVIEGLRLRAAGEKCEILVMGAATKASVYSAIEAGLQLAVFQTEMLDEISACALRAGKGPAKVHIKVDTGMNRIGARVGEELDGLIRRVASLSNIEVAGVFTHFATADEYESPHTIKAYRLFKEAVAQVRGAGLSPEYIHCSNSGATVWLKEAMDFCTHVRPGSLYLGYDVMVDRSNPLKVAEAASWRARITNIHTVNPGEGVGYSRHFQPQKPTKVATVDIGYGDGLFRPMVQNGGPVLIGDTRTKYLACCMDQCMVDASGIDCKVGDEVTIIGYSRGGALLSAFEIEAFTGQCYQNALCSINDRVARVYTE